MKEKEYVSIGYAFLRDSQIKLLKKTISWREKHIKSLTRQNKAEKTLL